MPVVLIAALAPPALSGATTAGKVRQTAKTLHCKPAKRSHSPVRIVVIGSSIAFGVGATPDVRNSWAGLYESYLKRLNRRNKLINLAVPGYTSPMELPTGSPVQAGRAIDTKHNITAALAKKPDAVIMSLTTNDAAAAIPSQQTIANFRTIVKAANKKGVEVWVTTPAPRALDSAGQQLLAQVRQAVTQTFVRHSLDFWTPTAGPDGHVISVYDSGDGIHPNNAGHALLYQQVVKAKIPRSLACR